MIDKFQEFVKVKYGITLPQYQIEIAKAILEAYIEEMARLQQCSWQ